MLLQLEHHTFSTGPTVEEIMSQGYPGEKLLVSQYFDLAILDLEMAAMAAATSHSHLADFFRFVSMIKTRHSELADPPFHQEPIHQLHVELLRRFSFFLQSFLKLSHYPEDFAHFFLQLKYPERYVPYHNAAPSLTEKLETKLIAARLNALNSSRAQSQTSEIQTQRSISSIAPGRVVGALAQEYKEMRAAQTLWKVKSHRAPIAAVLPRIQGVLDGADEFTRQTVWDGYGVTKEFGLVDVDSQTPGVVITEGVAKFTVVDECLAIAAQINSIGKKKRYPVWMCHLHPRFSSEGDWKLSTVLAKLALFLRAYKGEIAGIRLAVVGDTGLVIGHQPNYVKALLKQVGEMAKLLPRSHIDVGPGEHGGFQVARTVLASADEPGLYILVKEGKKSVETTFLQ